MSPAYPHSYHQTAAVAITPTATTATTTITAAAAAVATTANALHVDYGALPADLPRHLAAAVWAAGLYPTVWVPHPAGEQTT